MATVAAFGRRHGAGQYSASCCSSTETESDVGEATWAARSQSLLDLTKIGSLCT
jgi:hypothetical protein